ncbi:MAG: host attachment family protein [Pseudomonadota bacterium]
MSEEKFALKHGGWIVFADGEKALFLRNDGDEKFPNLDVFREEEHDNPPNREQKANRAGRFNDGPNAHRSAVQDTDWHELEKERFAADLAEILYKKAHANKFSDLILVATPQTLGDLRKELHQSVTDKLVGEVDKNLSNHPVEAIEGLVLQSDPRV